MKKYIILILTLFMISGCSNFNHEINEKRNELINNIGVTSDEKIVIKNKKGTQYYVYNILNQYSYSSYIYIFHKDEKTYNDYVSSKEDISYYDLKKYDDIYVTKVKYTDASIRDNSDIKEVILSKYQDDKNYIIVK